MSKREVRHINFNFDVSSYRLLGRELISDRITALFEIVKNSYDANATNVTVEFIDINPLSKKSQIIITDDGGGMEFDDIRYRWMVIGTSSKRRDKCSAPPFNRKVVGKKGIGRFAVDLLGSKLTLKTKKLGSDELICLETDWSQYSDIEAEQLKLDLYEDKEYFTDIKNDYWYEAEQKDMQGTKLIIENINEPWTENDVKRAYKELSKLVSPNKVSNTKNRFKITIKSQYQEFKKIDVRPQIIDFATKVINLTFDKTSQTQQICVFEKEDLITKSAPKRIFGYIDFKLYYFDQAAKRKFKDHFGTDIDGIKIYRDGIITTPFAEAESSIEKQKDILGIDKRRYSGFFDRLNSRDLLGFVEITEENNPSIVESTNRQDFLDTKGWKELKLFIIEQIQQLEKLLQFERQRIRKATKSDLGGTSQQLKVFKKKLTEVRLAAPPELKDKLRIIEADLGKIQGSVSKSIREYHKLEEETKQQENLFFSLVSLQTYAAMFSHMTKHTIGHVLRDAEYFNDYYPNPSLESRFKIISKRVYQELLNLRKGVDFMLKYAKSDSNIEELNLHDLVANLFDSIYRDRFIKEDIKATVELDPNLILRYNRKALEDIFDNLISNSIKALRGQSDKRIKCSSIVTNKELTILFSDNGIGIEDDDKFRIFDIFFTRTAEDGGSGIGLYMVKTRIESMQGSIEVTENEFKPSGATFKITLPFKK